VILLFPASIHDCVLSRTRNL